MTTTTCMTVDELTGVLGYMLTPTIESDDDLADNRVNVEETARAADALIRDGVSALCLNGTFGEVSTLTWNELQTFTSTVIEAAAGRVPVFAGATTLNTRDTIERAKRFKELGARGLMLGRPMMSPMSPNNILKYYADVANAVPSLAIFLYDDAEAFRAPIPTTVYREMARSIPQIIGAKYRSRLLVSTLATDSYNADLDAVNGRIKLLTGEFDWYYAYRMFDVTEAWSSVVCGGPAPVMFLQKLLAEGKWSEAQGLTREIGLCYENLIPQNNFAQWHVDKIPFMKARFTAAGYMTPGPSLPPYHELTPERRLIAEECGRRSKALQEKYSSAA